MANRDGEEIFGQKQSATVLVVAIKADTDFHV
jgi:hypothetical protein